MFTEGFARVTSWSSSSCDAISTVIPNPLSPHLPIIHYFQQVLIATSCIGTDLLFISSSWSSCLCSSIWMGPQEYITFVSVLTSPALSCMSGSSNLDSFCDGWLVAVQLLLCGVLKCLLNYYHLFAHSFIAPSNCSILLATFLCRCRQASSLYV